MISRVRQISLLICLIAGIFTFSPAQAPTCPPSCAAINAVALQIVCQQKIAYVGLAFGMPCGITPSQAGTYTILGGTNPTQNGLTLNVGSALSVSGTPTAGDTVSSWPMVQFVATATGQSTVTAVAVTAAAYSSIAVTPTGQSITTSAQLQMTATVTFDQGTPQDVTLSTNNTWSTSCGTSTGCTIGANTGLFTGGSAGGSPTVTATFLSHASSAVTVTVTSSSPAIANSSPLPNAKINIPYTLNFTATGGTPPYTWTIQSGNPAGCSTGCMTSSNNVGTMAFTPTTATTYASVVVRVTDSTTAHTDGTFSLTVASLSSVAVDCSPSPACRTTTQGSQVQFLATGTYSDSSTADVTNLTTGTANSTPTLVQSANNTSTTGGSVTLSVANGALPKATTANNFLHIGLREGVSNAPTWAITDSAGQSIGSGWTLVAANTTYNGTGDAMATYECANCMSVNSITISDGLTGGIISVFYEFSGVATSSPLDGSACTSALSPAATSFTSCSITTTNAADLGIFTVALGSANTLVAGNGYAFGSGQPGNTRVGMEYRTVTSTGTYTASMSWTPGTSVAGGIYAWFKALATTVTGWSATDLTGTGVAQMLSTPGLVQANNSGTSTIQACLGATCGTQVLTVTGTTITGLTLTPSGTISVPLNGTQSFTCKDQNGNDVTSTTFFHSSNSTYFSFPSGAGQHIGTAKALTPTGGVQATCATQ